MDRTGEARSRSHEHFAAAVDGSRDLARFTARRVDPSAAVHRGDELRAPAQSRLRR